MFRSFRAELLKLCRPAVYLGGGAALAAFTLLATVLTFTTATVTPVANSGGYVSDTLSQLAQSNGLTLGFANAGGFVGILIFVLFLTSMSTEYGQGTLRVLLTRQPRRTRLLAGKMLALLAVMGVGLLAAELFSGVASVLLANVRGIPTTTWISVPGLAHAAGNYANAFLTGGFYGAVGITLAVLIRNTPIALVVGLAWFLPLERTLTNFWSGAGAWLPGSLFGAVARGGAPAVSYQTALFLAIGYTGVGFMLASVSFARRDVSI
jgi:ABC-2 type transport system permease protein